MASTTLTYGAAPLTVARSMPVTANPPIAAAHGTSASFAGQLAPAAAHAAHTTKNVVDRKADDWVLPRGRRL